MKMLLLLISFNAYSQEHYYKETTSVVGYACPSGTYYRTDAKLCYPTPAKEEIQELPKIEGQIGVKRRKSLDKQAVLSSVAKAMDGDWIQEEQSNDDLVLEE
jgi:hypothetical protein